MTGKTLCHPTSTMGASPLFIQLPYDRLIAQPRLDGDSRAVLVTGGAGADAGRTKDECSMRIVAGLLSNLSVRAPMFRMATGTGLSLSGERAVPPRHR